MHERIDHKIKALNPFKTCLRQNNKTIGGRVMFENQRHSPQLTGFWRKCRLRQEAGLSRILTNTDLAH